jgi:hypothetical protein
VKVVVVERAAIDVEAVYPKKQDSAEESGEESAERRSHNQKKAAWGMLGGFHGKLLLRRRTPKRNKRNALSGVVPTEDHCRGI